MRGFGASLRNDLCTTEETFPLVLLFEMMILRRNAAVIDESQFIWVHTPLKYWYLSSKSFSTRPPNSHRTRLCSVSSLSHIKLFPSLRIVLFHFYSCAFSSLFDKKKLPLSFYFLYPVSFFLTPSCSLIFTLCTFVIFFLNFVFSRFSYFHFTVSPPLSISSFSFNSDQRMSACCIDTKASHETVASTMEQFSKEHFTSVFPIEIRLQVGFSRDVPVSLGQRFLTARVWVWFVVSIPCRAQTDGRVGGTKSKLLGYTSISQRI